MVPNQNLINQWCQIKKVQFIMTGHMKQQSRKDKAIRNRLLKPSECSTYLLRGQKFDSWMGGYGFLGKKIVQQMMNNFRLALLAFLFILEYV